MKRRRLYIPAIAALLLCALLAVALLRPDAYHRALRRYGPENVLRSEDGSVWILTERGASPGVEPWLAIRGFAVPWEAVQTAGDAAAFAVHAVK